MNSGSFFKWSLSEEGRNFSGISLIVSEVCVEDFFPLIFNELRKMSSSMILDIFIETNN